jgi:segregation and condensation protein A
VPAEYVVRLPVFEGPLELLLTLIQRASLDITTVALAQVTDQYLAHLATVEQLDPDAIADFCEVAATLMLLKSRALLPRPPLAADEAAEEAGEALAERLRAYRRYRQAAATLGERERAGLHAYVRAAPPPDLAVPLDPGGVTAADLAAAFQAALASAAEAAADQPPPAPGVGPPAVRLADRLQQIGLLLAERGTVSFREVLLGHGRDREYVVVSFLAVLELLRRRVLRAVQAALFDEILLEMRPDAGPPASWLAAESFLDDPVA